MRKFVKRVFSILVTLTLLITSEVPAFATDLQPEIGRASCRERV